VCCGVLQRVAAWYSTLQCVAHRNETSHKYDAVCCSVLQCAAVCYSALQCVAVCCSVLQFVAVYCSVLQCVLHIGIRRLTDMMQCDLSVDRLLVPVSCSVLQCVAACCSVV